MIDGRTWAKKRIFDHGEEVIDSRDIEEVKRDIWDIFSD